MPCCSPRPVFFRVCFNQQLEQDWVPFLGSGCTLWHQNEHLGSNFEYKRNALGYHVGSKLELLKGSSKFCHPNKHRLCAMQANP
eukprot:10016397-Karenia_brevis.AAC.1